MKLLWLTDIHLDHADYVTRQVFYKKLKSGVYDAAVITGDISISSALAAHLGELAVACHPRKVYFVLGNHDFYGGSFSDVDRIAAECCRKHRNLCHLGHEENIRLSPTSVLVGHRGWADGRAYGGRRTVRRFPDQDAIRDLRYQSNYPSFRKMERLGRESGAYFRRVLPYVLSSYRHVFIATHVPPFAKAVWFNGRPCEPMTLPHYVNASAGAVIKRISEHFPKTKITVLCGHTHSAITVQIANNIEVRTGQSRRGTPDIQGIVELF
ncbi:MAG: metallophosphoesterase [Chthoniobacterales bacterium]|nr:metallophosphoesterase [Chthoniobacterales bacterium]